MKRIILMIGIAFAMQSAIAQDNPYIVKTKGVKKSIVKLDQLAPVEQNAAPENEDFLSKNFRFQSMCDWKEGMRFMVIPEKYDLLVNTFRDATTNKEVSSGMLRHRIMIYKGHELLSNGRTHVNFTCADDNRNYYYELPNGTFEDYCFGKMGVPTLAYLGDVDKARELLLGKLLLTRTQHFRVDTDYDGDGYREVTEEKNKVVEVKAIGVGTRSFPVKIIVEDENGHQFYQNVAMSKTNSGMRDDEFIVDNEKFLFKGSFDFTDDNMAVSHDIKEYLGQTVFTKIKTSMSSKGSGKVRDIVVPRFTGFIIDEITPIRGNYYTLTMRETETRRVYYKDITFSQVDEQGGLNDKNDDYFGRVFGLGEGMARSTSKETRAAIREGRVIPGMTKDEVLMAVGEPNSKIMDSEGNDMWLYARSNGAILDVKFNEQGSVASAKARQGAKKASGKHSRRGGGIAGGKMKTGTPINE